MTRLLHRPHGLCAGTAGRDLASPTSVIIEWVPAGWVPVEAEERAMEESVSQAVRG
jgi:hypothetical protein